MHVLVVIEIIVDRALVKSAPITVLISIILVSNAVMMGVIAVTNDMSNPITTCNAIANGFTKVL